jgi:hypothetical protein
MRTRSNWVLSVVTCFWFALYPAQGRTLKVTELRCEYAVNPLGVDFPAPRLFWVLESSVRGQCQTSYQILVASSRRLLGENHGDLWDTGKVDSDETIQIPYAGTALSSAQQVFWKVRSWDKDSDVSDWSEPASWTMGLMTEADWAAQWIGSTNFDKGTAPQSLMLRREFLVKPGLSRALAFVCGLGCYEMKLNNVKASDALFPPGWTKYDATCLYDTYDITALLRKGTNAAGLLLGNGMYNVLGGRYTKFKGSFGPLKAIALLRLEYSDGSVEFIGTDAKWRVSPGPITFSCVYGGEDYDARLEPTGWTESNFDDSKWEPPFITKGPGGKLRGLSCSGPPVRAFEILKPLKVTTVSHFYSTNTPPPPAAPGTVSVYDLGQNAALMPQFKVRGSAGASVRIIPAELVAPDGSVDRRSCGHGRPAYWQYTLSGKGTETWFPKFFYQGCRYLQVERTPGPDNKLPEVLSLEGLVVHADSPPTGEFECSNELFNRIRRLVLWAQRSNMVSIMTDCPHREKLGWLEEDHLNGPALRYEFDLARLSSKILNDIADSQCEDGLVPNIAPEYVKFKGGFRDSPEWGSACILVPWQQYEFTADTKLLQRNYTPMQRYVAYLGTTATNNIVSHGLGDWYDIGPRSPGVAQLTPVPLTATAFYYCDVSILSQVAALLGKAEDAKQYEDLASKIRDAFNQTFFSNSNSFYATGSQCANAIALVMGLPEPAERPVILDSLVKDIRAHSNGLTAGDVGYRYLLRALADGDRSDVIFDINNQSDKPGYAYQLRQGATSLTEAWNARRSSSQNHFMLGQITEWFYHDLAGIISDPSVPGFKKVIIRPSPVGDVAWLKSIYKSIHGPIVCEWDRKDTTFTLKTTIPANTTATVFVPAKTTERLTESGSPAARAPGVSFIRQEGNYAVYEVKSGEYLFRSKF